MSNTEWHEALSRLATQNGCRLDGDILFIPVQVENGNEISTVDLRMRVIHPENRYEKSLAIWADIFARFSLAMEYCPTRTIDYDGAFSILIGAYAEGVENGR